MKIQLYRYFGSHAFETLRDKRMMLARPRTLNDPFEFLYKSKGQITMPKSRQYIKSRMKSDSFYAEFKKQYPHIKSRKAFKALMREKLEELAKNYFDKFDEILPLDPEHCKDLADRHFRLACFSAPVVLPHEEILMWSHYAAKHTGVRILFSLDDEVKYPYFLKKVIYSKERAGLDLTDTAETEKVKDEMIEAIRTKAEGWAYEREYRLFSLPSICVQESGSDGVIRSFMPFSPNIVLRVDLGLDCPAAEVERISKLIKSDYPHVELWKACYHKSEYAIEYKKSK